MMVGALMGMLILREVNRGNWRAANRWRDASFHRLIAHFSPS